jgi:hypothetical protein
MSTPNKYIFLLLSLFVISSLEAQVKFKLSALEDGFTYQVSLIPEASFDPPFNLTSSAQVTIKVPTDGFELSHINSLQAGVIWEMNSLTKAPKEAPEFDYVSFDLKSAGTKLLTYKKGVELPLFQFTNYLECSGTISLMDNANDAFSPPNSRTVNVGNQITILGAKGEAYTANAAENSVACQSNLTNIEEIDGEKLQLKLFPNPAIQYIAIHFNWDKKQEKAQLNLRDLSGKVIQKLDIELLNGKNEQQVDVKNLAQGAYFIELNGHAWKLTSDQFMKIDKL